MIGIVPQEIDDYAFDHTTPLPPVMEELRKATYDSAPDAEMLSDRLIGTLLQTLIRVSGAKRVTGNWHLHGIQRPHDGPRSPGGW